MGRNLFKSLLLFATGLLAVSCLIENDMSYPSTEAVILSMQVEGQKDINIDTEAHTVEIVLEESADRTRLKLLSMQLNEGAEVDGQMPDFLDLSKPLELTLRVYKDTKWTIKSVQPIERYIVVENQVGEATFDPESKTAVLYVSEYQPLKSVNFLDMKLEPIGSRVVSTTGFVHKDHQSVQETLSCEFPMTLECVMLRTFCVEYNGQNIDWTVRVQKTEVALQIVSVNAWARQAEVKAAYDGQGTPVIEYRKVSEQVWRTVSDAVVAQVGISAVLKGLEPDTDYVVRVFNDGDMSAEYEFRTEAEAQLYNMGFDEWWINGKVWYPFAEGAEPSVWDSANPGAATFIGSSTTPENTFVVEGKAARMESKYAVIAFAAGNIYTGAFGKIAGVGAELDWGVPFASRPKSLKGYYSYSPKPIDRVNKEKLAADGMDADALLGTMDRCQIQVILTDWDEPFHVNTNAGQFVDIEKDEHIIAHALLETDVPTDGYEPFELELVYRDKTRTPKYVVISACASYLGDYFTGGVGSLMYVDEFEFVY